MCERKAESYLSPELCSIFSLPPLPPWHGRKVKWESEMMGFASCKRAHQRVALIALISSPQQSMTPCVVLTPLRVSQAVSQLMETKQVHVLKNSSSVSIKRNIYVFKSFFKRQNDVFFTPVCLSTNSFCSVITRSLSSRKKTEITGIIRP